MALEALVPAVPEMVGGSADLTGSNNTKSKGIAAYRAGQFRRPLSSITASANSAWRRR